MKIGVLFSSGKDSTYAAFLAKKFGHDISCLITLESINKESYMFHTPNIKIAKLCAKAMDIPIIYEETEGKKEEELKDLKKIIEKAKEEFKIEGIVTGALSSVYQGTRIQNICNDLDLWCFNPLWQKDQEQLIREIIKSKFKFIITKIAAFGLDKTWLGKVIEQEDIDKLIKLNKKYKINIAFEGGEAETLVLDCPLFKSKLKILESRIVMENKFTGIYLIERVRLI